MLKTISLVFGLILLLSIASAEVTLRSPSLEQLPAGGYADIGKLQAGDVLILSFSNKTGYGEETRWVKISEKLSVLPAGWEFAEFQENELTLTAEIIVPKSVVSNPYNLKIVLESDSPAVPSESVNLRMLVAENLLQSSVTNLSQEIMVNESAEFGLVLDNTASIASHTVLVNSTLSNNWFVPVSVEVAPGEIKEVKLTVMSQYYGTTPFQFMLQSATNGNHIASYNAELNVHPTLVGKYTAALSGFPIFSASLAPYYMINALLSLVFR